MIKCIAVDDEPLALRLIESYINENPSLQLVGTFSDPQDAFDAINNNDIDLAFLDIQMAGLSGIELAGKIDTFTTKVVFTTAFAYYALDGFRVDAVDYLLKPISYDAFEKSVQKVERLMGVGNRVNVPASEEYMVVKSEHKLVKIYYNDILYIESLKDYISIALSDGTQIKTLSTLKGTASTLPQDRFIRVHRSFIVNAAKVKVIERNSIIFGKKSIPVSDMYRADAYKVLGLR